MSKRLGFWAGVLLACFAVMVGTRASAQTLSTPPWDGQYVWWGLMFDVEANADTTLQSISVTPFDGSGEISIYGRPGSYAGFESSSAGWTLLETRTIMAELVPMEIPISARIPPGQTYAIYIRPHQRRIGVADPTDPGGVNVSDGVLTIRDGPRLNSLFTPAFPAVVQSFRGSITYAPTPVPVPTLTEWSMILLGLLLAGGAAVLIQRRSQAV